MLSLFMNTCLINYTIVLTNFCFAQHRLLMESVTSSAPEELYKLSLVSSQGDYNVLTNEDNAPLYLFKQIL